MDTDALTVEPAGIAELDASHFAVHPYKKSRDKVALVGMAKTTRHLVPWDDDEFEIWGLNESYAFHITGQDKLPYFKRWTRWFQIHPEWDFMRSYNFNDPEHSAWIRNENNRRRIDFPIYALEQYDYPGFVRYPALDIWDSFSENRALVENFQSSFDFMIAMAIWMGFEEIHPFGYEMRADEEYRHQRPSAWFWAGAAAGRGIKIREPEESRMFNKALPLYGYEKIPGITAMHTEIKFNEAKRQVQQNQAKLNHIIGKKMKLIREMQAIKSPTPKFVEKKNREMSQIMEEEIGQMNILNSWLGQMAMAEAILKDIRGVPDPTEVKIIQPKHAVQVINIQTHEKDKIVS